MTKMPHFVIGGERRSGSTTLYKMLNVHPEVAMYPVADMDYFIKPELFAARRWYVDRDRDREWYATHTPEVYAARFDGLFNPGKRVGQKDADLLFWRPAHGRLRDFVPNAKFIFVLREPAGRAESQYWNEVAKGRETLSFEEALNEEERRSGESDYGRLHLNYKERGRYIESIEHFRRYFPDDQILIVILEKLKNDPKSEFERIGAFLDIDPSGFAEAESIHSNHQEVLAIKKRYRGTWIEKAIHLNDRIAEAFVIRISRDMDVRDKWRKLLKSFGKESVRQQRKMDADLREELKRYYRDSNRALEAYLGYEIPEWR